MATSANPAFKSYSPFTQVVLHVSLKTAQAGALITPPAYVAWTLLRRGRARPFSISRLMRASTTGVVVGAVLGTGMGYARLANQPEDAIVDRTVRLAHNRTQVRCDDYSLIGASLGAIVSPAILLRRAPLPILVLGGASIGLGAGVWVHITKLYTEGENARPDAMASEIPVLSK